MAKRKNRRSSKSVFRSVSSGFEAIGSFLIRIVPVMILIVGAGGVFLGVRSALYADTNLNVAKVMIEPADALSHEVRSKIEAETFGKNILNVDLDKIAKRLERDPRIQKAEIRRSLPAELQIRIHSRMPVARVQFAPKGTFWIMAGDGMILEAETTPSAAYVLIEAFHLDLKRPQAGMFVDNRAVLRTLDFLKRFWQHASSKQETVTLVTIDKIGNVMIRFGTGPDVRLGRDPASKLGLIEKIIPLLMTKDRYNISYIDLQYEDVIVKRKP